jgi:hypothetical protein
MAEARQHDAWSRTAALLALLANCHRDPRRSRAFTVADFHPLMDHAEAKPPLADVSVLKAVFINHHLPEMPP